MILRIPDITVLSDYSTYREQKSKENIYIYIPGCLILEVIKWFIGLQLLIRMSHFDGAFLNCGSPVGGFIYLVHTYLSVFRKKMAASGNAHAR